MRRFGIVLATVVSLLFLGIQPAAAAPPPVEVVHTEKIQAGPYAVTVSFSEWPLRAERSLDFLFEPAGGIAGRTGSLRMVAPDGSTANSTRDALSRHPRARQAWGLDVYALASEGTWTFEVAVKGTQGTGIGRLPIAVGERPGPPAAFSWTLGLLPLLAFAGVAVLVWVRTRPYRRETAAQW